MRYPEVTVQLTGTDGNAFAIIGKVSKALPREARKEFTDAAFACESYDHLLRLCMDWVDVR